MGWRGGWGGEGHLRAGFDGGRGKRIEALGPRHPGTCCRPGIRSDGTWFTHLPHAPVLTCRMPQYSPDPCPSTHLPPCLMMHCLSCLHRSSHPRASQPHALPPNRMPCHPPTCPASAIPYAVCSANLGSLHLRHRHHHHHKCMQSTHCPHCTDCTDYPHCTDNSWMHCTDCTEY